MGPVTAKRLRAIGVTKTVELRGDRPRRCSSGRSAAPAEWLVQLAHGIDDRPVEPDRPAKSSGTENTYPQDLVDLDRIREEIAAMAREAAGWLERHELFARTVTIKVRYSDFTTITRSHSSLARHARRRRPRAPRRSNCSARTEAGRRPVRLLGVTVHNLDEVPGEALPRRAAQTAPAVRWRAVTTPSGTAGGRFSTFTRTISTRCFGVSPSTATPSMASTTAIPSTTRPNAV